MTAIQLAPESLSVPGNGLTDLEGEVNEDNLNDFKKEREEIGNIIDRIQFDLKQNKDPEIIKTYLRATQFYYEQMFSGLDKKIENYESDGNWIELHFEERNLP